MPISVPSAPTPEAVHAVIEDTFNRGDIHAFIAAHEADATDNTTPSKSRPHLPRPTGAVRLQPNALQSSPRHCDARRNPGLRCARARRDAAARRHGGRLLRYAGSKTGSDCARHQARCSSRTGNRPGARIEIAGQAATEFR